MSANNLNMFCTKIQENKNRYINFLYFFITKTKQENTLFKFILPRKVNCT